MAAIRILPKNLEAQEIHHILQEREFSIVHNPDGLSADELLMKSTKVICQRHSIAFVRLSPIQRKFLTYYRCDQCGLLPLYHINLSHIKRVRCRNCGQLVAFRGNGKYGKLRKEIAFELLKEIK